MLRGFRWQFLALVLAVGMFAASLVVRNQPLPTQVVTPTLVLAATSTPVADQTLSVTLGEPTRAPQVASQVSSGVVFREGLIGTYRRLNPLFVSLNNTDRDIASFIFEGLTRTNNYGEPQPLLARNWVISSDGLEYVFTLRDDVLWQDGTPFTALDVAFTMGLLRDPSFPGDPEIGAFWRTVETEQLGTHLIRFRLTQPLGTFLDNLQIGILPEHALRGTDAEQLLSHPINLTPIGTGPYQLEAVESVAEAEVPQVILRTAPAYSSRQDVSGSAVIERIIFRLYSDFSQASAALVSGEIDGLAGRTADERLQLLQNNSRAPAFNIFTQTEPTLGVLIFNWERETVPFLREQRVRVALQRGLDRGAIIDRNLTGIAVPANSPLIPGSWAYQSDLPWAAFDPAAALSELSAATQRLAAEQTAVPGDAATDEVTTFFNLAILAPDSPPLINLANEIAAQWSQLNLTTRVEVVDEADYRERLETGEFDVALVEYSLGGSADPDVYPFWNQGQTPPDGLNYGGADDGRISELLERARREASGLNRISLYRDFQAEFAERAIAIPLYYPLFTYAVSSAFGDIQLGFIGSPADRFRTLASWTVQ